MKLLNTLGLKIAMVPLEQIVDFRVCLKGLIG